MIYQQQIPKDFKSITAIPDNEGILLKVCNETHCAIIDCENVNIAIEEMRSLLKEWNISIKIMEE